MRVFRLQICPELRNEPMRSAATAAEKSASSSRMAADLPPSSSVIGRINSPHKDASRLPAAVEPVNDT